MKSWYIWYTLLGQGKHYKLFHKGLHFPECVPLKIWIVYSLVFFKKEIEGGLVGMLVKQLNLADMSKYSSCL